MGDKETVRITPEPVGSGAGRRFPEPLRWDDETLQGALARIPGSDDRPGPHEPVRLGRLELIARIGVGGMGEVYAAHDLELDRQVAVKIVRSTANTDRHDASARIVREAQMMARVTHPNVVRVYDVGRIEARVYITMEYIQGTTLREWLERAPRTWREILDPFIRAGRGLAAAHRTGLVHRDFKPSNVLVGDDGRILVADFGLARVVASEPDTASASTHGPVSSLGLGSSPSSPPLTVHGTVLGTPGYMSPEQLHARPVDARSDLFSFCVALYEALHGIRPYAGRSVESLLANIDAGAIAPPLAHSRVPTGVARAIVRGLAADPNRRFATMDELLDAIERALRRPGRFATASLVLAVGLVAGGAVADVGPFAEVDPCAAAGGELADIWNDARRADLHARFAATDLEFADAAATRVAAQLDDYTAAWRLARADACAATEVRRDQSPELLDLRVACLDRRLRAVRALVDNFAAADRTTVEAAVAALASLPALEPCADGEALLRGLRPPETAALAAATTDTREQLARAGALAATGHFRDGLALVDTVFTETGGFATAYEPVRAEALALRGRLLGQVGSIVEAEATLLEAVELAEANRHDELAADVWLDLLRLTNLQLIDPARGMAWMPRARAAQRRIGDPPARRLLVLSEQGLLLSHAHDYLGSERALRVALALHADIGGDPRILGKLAHNLGSTLHSQNRLAEARAAYVESAAALTAAFGPDHPETARVLHDFGTLLTILGELDAAEPRILKALEIFLNTYGPSQPLVGRMYVSLVEVSLRRGDFKTAIARAATAVRFARETLPDGHTGIIDAEVALGTARFFGGELEAALEAFLAARALQRRTARTDAIDLAVTAVDIAETQIALARHADAAASFTEVERLLARAPIRDRDLEARVLTGRGQIALADGDPRRALPLLEQALDLRRDLPDDPLARAELEATLRRVEAALARRAPERVRSP